MENSQIEKSTNVIEQQILSLTDDGLQIYEYFMQIKFIAPPTHAKAIPHSERETIGRSGPDNFYTYKMYVEQDGKHVFYHEFDNAIDWLHCYYFFPKEGMYKHLNEVFNLGLSLIFNAN